MRPHRSSLIAHDHYVLAVASMELGLLYLDQGMLDHAERQLLSAKYVTHTDAHAHAHSPLCLF